MRKLCVSQWWIFNPGSSELLDLEVGDACASKVLQKLQIHRGDSRIFVKPLVGNDYRLLFQKF